MSKANEGEDIKFDLEDKSDMRMLYQREDGDSINLVYEKDREKPWSVLTIDSYYTDDGGSSISYNTVAEFETMEKAIDFTRKTYYDIEDYCTFKSKLLGGKGWV